MTVDDYSAALIRARKSLNAAEHAANEHDWQAMIDAALEACEDAQRVVAWAAGQTAA